MMVVAAVVVMMVAAVVVVVVVVLVLVRGSGQGCAGRHADSADHKASSDGGCNPNPGPTACHLHSPPVPCHGVTV
jgi:hypothetical protein